MDPGKSRNMPLQELLASRRPSPRHRATDEELAVLSNDATIGTFLRLTSGYGMLTASIGRDGPRLVGEDQFGSQEDLFNPVPKVRPLR